ncbi:hypothetical protein DMC30DRAFT_229393 [Rhodotorula diobovata]|uniref:Uncharacterized protein n=1 Tax=Rhodotorula diobovata TaxID=5288 RepID=A0A5C5FXJ6_9BASI|nr:hypothetical protein DMC30DRAFT_229393 [Rhodotorula diobovata]
MRDRSLDSLRRSCARPARQRARGQKVASHTTGVRKTRLAACPQAGCARLAGGQKAAEPACRPRLAHEWRPLPLLQLLEGTGAARARSSRYALEGESGSRARAERESSALRGWSGPGRFAGVRGGAVDRRNVESPSAWPRSSCPALGPPPSVQLQDTRSSPALPAAPSPPSPAPFSSSSRLSLRLSASVACTRHLEQLRASAPRAPDPPSFPPRPRCT